MSWRGTSVALGVVLVIGLARAGGHARAQGEYAPVTIADVRAMKLNHYFTSDRKGRAADFSWTFAEKTFVIRKGAGPIPADLVSRLLPAGVSAEVIEGTWELGPSAAGPITLILSRIRVGDEVGKARVAFPIYRTAPTVIRVGEPQYVFSLL